LANPATVQELLRIKQERDVELIVIDSLTLGAFDRDVGQSQDTVGLLKGLEPLGTVLAVDHTRKPQPGEKIEQLRAFGSVFKGNIGRSSIHVINREEGLLELRHAKANFSAKQEPMFVRVRFEGVDPDQTVYIEPQKTHGLKLVLDELPAREKVYETIQRLGLAEIGQLMEALPSMARKTIKNHCSDLVREGRVIQPDDNEWTVTMTDEQIQEFIGDGGWGDEMDAASPKEAL
jgi:hypothetical protein